MTSPDDKVFMLQIKRETGSDLSGLKKLRKSDYAQQTRP